MGSGNNDISCIHLSGNELKHADLRPLENLDEDMCKNTFSMLICTCTCTYIMTFYDVYTLSNIKLS